MKATIFSAAFRPFFFLCAIAGLLLPKFWISYYLNNLSYHGAFISLLNWHSYEMLFGFTEALLAGFLLTASVNWSGRAPLKGWWLASLSLLWIIERFANILPLSQNAVLFLNAPFSLLFIYMAGNQMWKNKNFKIMIPFLILMLVGKYLLLLGDFSDNIGLAKSGRDLGLGLIRYILALMSCRLIPFFTSKRFPEYGSPAVALPIRYAFLSGLIIVDTFHVFSHFFPVTIPLQIAILLTTALGFGVWGGMLPHKTYKEPMLLILNLAMLWLILSLPVEFLQPFNVNLQAANIPIHMLTAGALGCFSIGMMTRVSLGHTGRPIKATKGILFMFALIILGAIGRTLLPLISYNAHVHGLHTVGGLWVGAYFVYLIIFSKKLFRPRPDGKAF